MINALVTKNGQSALISLPAKRIGLARDLASIGVASPPSELYPHDDELTIGLKYFGTDDFSDRLITLIQSEDSLARVNTLVELYGDLPVAQREKVKASVLSGEMTSLNDFKNSILENKAPAIVQNYYCPLMCTLYLRNRYGDLDYDPVEYDGEYAAKYEDEIRDLLIREQSDCNMAEYFNGPNSAVGKLESAVWDVERIHGCLYGKITATLNAPFTEEEQNCFMEWCEGQNSDGFGEGFEQRPIRTVDRSEMYVSFWQSGPDYFLCTENDLDHFIDHGMGEMN